MRLLQIQLEHCLFSEALHPWLFCMLEKHGPTGASAKSWVITSSASPSHRDQSFFNSAFNFSPRVCPQVRGKGICLFPQQVTVSNVPGPALPQRLGSRSMAWMAGPVGVSCVFLAQLTNPTNRHPAMHGAMIPPRCCMTDITASSSTRRLEAVTGSP